MKDKQIKSWVTTVLCTSFFSSIALGSPVTQAADSFKLVECRKSAALEFGVPLVVFEAMALHEEKVSPPNNGSKDYGPMNINELAVPMVTKILNSSEEKVKSEPCENYRAAAAFLMSKPDSDIWVKMNKYYYGSLIKNLYPKTEAVKSVYADLIGDNSWKN